MIRLIPIDIENIALYQNFVDCYSDLLRDYMSRIFPHEYQRYQTAVRSAVLRWYYITYQTTKIGSVWLEKQKASDTSAFLGIFICEDRFRGKGFGKQAIDTIIDSAANDMKVDNIQLHVRASNSRAVHCYQKCGFQVIEKGVGPSGQLGYVMQKHLEPKEV